ncbi:MAG TPA: gliding motility-associated C-terminal domain-containing protein [Bacteroidia bacterium]|nr:gliding motility-associated C-terminal domain-containing protein [Bacteroidia bacterium]
MISVLKDTVICTNTLLSANLDAFYPGTASYTWSDGFSGPLHNLTTAGIYWVDYTLNNHCTARDSFRLQRDSIPSVHITQDSNACRTSCVLQANTSFPCSWSTGSTAGQISISTSGTYALTITGNGGCKNSETVNVLLYAPPQLPNIVTPNGDGRNDAVDFGTYGFTGMNLRIYNRWGQAIFESSDPHCVWKPECSSGTYYYIVSYQDCESSSRSKTLQGYVMVIR